MRFINHNSHTRECADAPTVGQARRRLKNLMRERSAYMGAEIYLHFAQPQINFKHMKYNYIWFLLFAISLGGFSQCLQAQKVVQIEKSGSPHTTKLFIGQGVEYKIKNDDLWRFAYIEDILIEQGIVLLGSRYVKIEDIEAFRWDRRLAKAAGKSLFLFGTAWSAFALVGFLTDGDPSTSYRPADAIVTGSSWFLAFAISRLFRYKVVKFGKRKRLRLLDLTFLQVVP